MTDIVERLNLSWNTDRSIISQTDGWAQERKEAATEITRLRAALRNLAADCTCRAAYYERGLRDPSCPAYLYGDEALEALGEPPACRADYRNRAAYREADT